MAKKPAKARGKRRRSRSPARTQGPPRTPRSGGFRYRDSETGRFVSKRTWKRSKARGGTRYKRQRIVPVRPPAKVLRFVEYKFYLSYLKRKKLDVEIFVYGPPGITKEEGLAVMEEWLFSGTMPKGWKQPHLIIFRRKKYHTRTRIEEFRNIISGMLASGNSQFSFEPRSGGNQ